MTPNQTDGRTDAVDRYADGRTHGDAATDARKIRDPTTATDRPTIHLMSQEGQGGRPAVEGPVPQKMVAFETKDRSLKISEMLTMHVRHLFCWP